MKCSLMLHLIWFFTVCKNTRLEVSRIQKVKGSIILHKGSNTNAAAVNLTSFFALVAKIVATFTFQNILMFNVNHLPVDSHNKYHDDRQTSLKTSQFFILSSAAKYIWRFKH